MVKLLALPTSDQGTADFRSRDHRFSSAGGKLLFELRVATVREKLLENNFFPGQGKIREFCDWSGKFGKDFECQAKSQGI